MSLSSGDKNNLKQLGKECKQAQYPISPLMDFLRTNNPAFGALVNTVCLNDDGQIDATEAQLIRWARTFVFTIGGVDIMEAENILQDGYYSA